MADVSRSAKTFTPKQGQYLAFIDAYTRVHCRPPAEWEMQRYFGVPALGPPNDPDPRTRRLHSPPSGRAAQHRGTRSSRATTRLASSNPTRQNLCDEVLVAPTGLIEIRNEFVIGDSGLRDAVVPHAAQVPLHELPDEALVYLLGKSERSGSSDPENVMTFRLRPERD